MGFENLEDNNFLSPLEKLRNKNAELFSGFEGGKHPEQRDGEIFLTNVLKYSKEDKNMQKKYKTLRYGAEALEKEGKVFRAENFYPVFL